MQVDDFFIEAHDTDDPWGVGSPKLFLRTDLLNSLRSGPLPDEDDLSTAIALTRLVHGELESYGTDGTERLNNDEISVAQRSLRVTLERHGIRLSLPWRDYSTFRGYWLRNEASGSWQARRDILSTFFDPVFEQLYQLEEAAFSAGTAVAVSPRAGTGWPAVDTEIAELRKRFRSAITPQDFRDVGNRCVAVLETLSRTVYDPTKHLREGETEPPVDKTKLRLGRYVEDSLAGKDNEEVRGVANKVSELAHKVKHRPLPSRRDAGIVADAVILLANILRRVDQDQ